MDGAARVRRPALTLSEWTYRMLVAAGVAAGALLLWRLSGVLLIAFGGVLLAVSLRAISDSAARHLDLSPKWALWGTLLALTLLVGAAGWLLGGQISDQLKQLSERLPQALDGFRDSIQGSPIGQAIPDLGSLMGSASSALSKLGTFTSVTLSGLADVLVLLFVALFLAADPEPYRRGALMLVPPSGRQRVAGALDATGEALRMWLLGKAIAMLAVGVLTTLGLWVLGVPLALSLGVIAGLLDFVPFIGPVVAALPAVLIAFSQQPMDALYTALLYAAIQQLEGNVISPLIQRRTVNLQPAVLILAIFGFGVVFGVPGVIFGAPLMVVVMVLVEKLYVEGALGKGDEAPAGASEETGARRAPGSSARGRRRYHGREGATAGTPDG